MPNDREPDFFAIDQNKLDREWVQQPALCRKYSERLAAAQQELEQAEAALEVMDADLDYKYRRRAEKEKKKVTETVIKSQVCRSIEHLTRVGQVQEARYKVNMLKAAVKTIDHRKTALENLVDLRLADYFSEPRAGKSSAADLDERRKERVRARGKETTDD